MAGTCRVSLVERGHAVLAANVVGFASALRARMKEDPGPNERRLMEQAAAGLRGELGDEGYEQAHAEGTAIRLKPLLSRISRTLHGGDPAQNG
jgi:hypothetical protein